MSEFHKYRHIFLVNEFIKLIIIDLISYPLILWSRVNFFFHVIYLLVFLKQLEDNNNYDVDSLQYSNNLNSYIDERQDIMLKLFTNVMCIATQPNVTKTIILW